MTEYRNQMDEPVKEEVLFADDLDLHTLREAFVMLLNWNNLTLYRTNATKHGNTQLELRADA